ncbi:hypothetical protein UT300018_03730 [Clostridium faecium]
MVLVISIILVIEMVLLLSFTAPQGNPKELRDVPRGGKKLIEEISLIELISTIMNLKHL